VFHQCFVAVHQCLEVEVLEIIHEAASVSCRHGAVDETLGRARPPDWGADAAWTVEAVTTMQL
jgi:hypothetical protein